MDELNRLIEEIILFDPNSETDFKHLRGLLQELEQSVSPEQHNELSRYLDEMMAEKSVEGMDESIRKFQESVESLRQYYTTGGTEDRSLSGEREKAGEEKPGYLSETELVEDFLQEGEEYLQVVEENLIALENAPGDTALIDSIFRPFHTIKGVAGFLGLYEIQDFAHLFEDLLEEVRNGSLSQSPELTDLILTGVDSLRGMLDAVGESMEAGEHIPHNIDVGHIINQARAKLGGVSVAHTTKTGQSESPHTEKNSAPESRPENERNPETEEATTNPPEESDEDDFDDLGADFLTDPELVQDYLQEGEDHLQSIEQHLIKWENDPDNLEYVDTIFRGFHTIKGVAGFLNLTDINRVSHEFENLLDEARSGNLSLTTAVTDVILSGVDALRAMNGAVAESIESGERVSHPVDVDSLLSTVQKFDPEAENKSPGKGTVYTDTQKEASVKNNAEPDKVEEKPSADPSTGKDIQEKAAAQRRRSGAIKVETEKMDYLIDMVGELVITQNMVAQNRIVRDTANKRLAGDMAQLKRITSTLQNISMSLRMIPIEATFRKMQRIVRDLAHKSGKQIELRLEGEQTEIDRNMVETLYDPLVHMVRNACDHGIELPEEREAAGKAPEGEVILNAYHKGGNVVIEISDDGAGLDKEAIMEKARSRDLLNEDEVLTDRQIYELLFQPGFSTAKSVTDVSGRGVGMDVVKRTIEKLRGQIDVESKQGEGSAFYIKLPLTLAIIDGVIVEVGTERYVIPTLSIEESVQPSKSDYNFIAGRGETIMVRDKIFPLVRLHDLFGVKNSITDPWEGIVMLVDAGGENIGILVDQLVDKQEIVIKSMGEQLQALPGISGGAILGDGTVGLILDVPSLLQIRDSRLRERHHAKRNGDSLNGADIEPVTTAETEGADEATESVQSK